MAECHGYEFVPVMFSCLGLSTSKIKVTYFTSREIAIQNTQTRRTIGKVKEQRTGALFYREKGGCWEKWL